VHEGEDHTACPDDDRPAATPAKVTLKVMRDAPKNAHNGNGIDRPWETAARQFRTKIFLGWRPLLERMAAGVDRSELSALCRASDVTREGLAFYCNSWMGARQGIAPETVRAFLTWADAKCAPGVKPARVTPAADAPPPAKPALAAAAAPAVVIGGEVFRFEVVVRLIPAGRWVES
jgi:hypothetical protein